MQNYDFSDERIAAFIHDAKAFARLTRHPNGVASDFPKVELKDYLKWLELRKLDILNEHLEALSEHEED